MKRSPLFALIAAVLALVMLFTNAPTAVLAASQEASAVQGQALDAPEKTEASGVKEPEGYNENDYNRVRTFLEIKRGAYKNGQLLNEAYDANDPTTWTGVSFAEVNGELRVVAIEWTGVALNGNLLDLSGLSALGSLVLHDANTNYIYLNDCTALTRLECINDALSFLQLSNCTALERIDISGERHSLTALNVFGKEFSSDLWPIGIRTEQEGAAFRRFIRVEPVEGFGFTGWFNGDTLFSTERELEITNGLPQRLRANCPIEMPSGLYNTHDINCLVEFFTMPSSNRNYTNGEALFGVGVNYQQDAGLWTGVGFEEVNGERRVASIDFTGFAPPADGVKLRGILNLANFKRLTSLKLPEGELGFLLLDGCSALAELKLGKNLLSEIGLEDSPLLPLELVMAQASGGPGNDENGSVGYEHDAGGTFVTAYDGPTEQTAFLGWYDTNDELISTEPRMEIDASFPVATLIARFGEREDGDAYNAHDLARLVAFLELTDENGVKNGAKFSQNYDPADPATWGNVAHDPSMTGFDFIWRTVEGEYRLERINWNYVSLVGELNVSGCTALKEIRLRNGVRVDAVDASECTALETINTLWMDERTIERFNVTGCTALKYMAVSSQPITELNVSGLTALEHLSCSNAQLTELDVSGLTRLRSLDCNGNALTSLELSGCTALMFLRCEDNELTELDLTGLSTIKRLDCSRNELTSLDVTSCPLLGCTEGGGDAATTYNEFMCSGNPLKLIDMSANPNLVHSTVRALGAGAVGYEHEGIFFPGSAGSTDLRVTVYAVPNPGASFLGWYDENGELLSSEEAFECTEVTADTLEARFALPGDVNGDGAVTSEDAVLIMRYSMGVIDGTALALNEADMNGDGSVDVIDALLVLRRAMGLS